MPKKKGATWKSTSVDGLFLTSVLKEGGKGHLSAAELRKLFPQFQKYNAACFQQNVRRIKTKLGIDAAKGLKGKAVF